MFLQQQQELGSQGDYGMTMNFADMRYFVHICPLVSDRPPKTFQTKLKGSSAKARPHGCRGIRTIKSGKLDTEISLLDL